MQCPKCGYEPTMSEMQASPDDCVKCRAHFASYKAPTVAERLAKGMKGARAAVAQGRAERNGSLYCPACGTTSEGQTHTRGSILIEIILWLCFLVPGIIYSIWRLTTRQKVCPACKNPGVIPINSPRARRELGIY